MRALQEALRTSATSAETVASSRSSARSSRFMPPPGVAAVRAARSLAAGGGVQPACSTGVCASSGGLGGALGGVLVVSLGWHPARSASQSALCAGGASTGAPNSVASGVSSSRCSVSHDGGVSGSMRIHGMGVTAVSLPAAAAPPCDPAAPCFARASTPAAGERVPSGGGGVSTSSRRVGLPPPPSLAGDAAGGSPGATATVSSSKGCAKDLARDGVEAPSLHACMPCWPSASRSDRLPCMCKHSHAGVYTCDT